MSLIDYISRHPVGERQPPANWDKQFVVTLIDDFVKCLEFQDSSNKNISFNENPIGYLAPKSSTGTRMLKIRFVFTHKLHSLIKVNCLKQVALPNQKSIIPHSTIEHKLNNCKYPSSRNTKMVDNCNQAWPFPHLK